VTPPRDAEMVGVLFLGTTLVVALKVAEVTPAGTVSVEGTVATDVLLLARMTTAPPVGAGLFRLTVPVDVVPPTTLIGFSTREETANGTMVKVADALFVA